MSGPEPSLSNWIHDQMVRIRDARMTGDRPRIEQLLTELGERDPRARQVAEQALAAALATEAGFRLPFPVGADLDGRGLCDFCAEPDPSWYFPMDEFEIRSERGTFLSGDRMYTCDPCKTLVDADDWAGVKARVGVAALNPGVAILWVGFRSNRTGGPCPRDGQPIR